MKATTPRNQHLKKLAMLMAALLAGALAFALFAPNSVPGGRDQALAATKTYKVIYHLNGGKNTKVNPKKIAAGKTVKLKNPTRAGYKFKGWYTTKKLKTKTTKAKGVAKASKRTVWAKWAVKSYRISYNLNGGTQAAEQPTSYTVKSSAFTLKAPTRAGYTFAGWTGTGLSAATKSVTVAKGSTGNRSYTATWTKIEVPSSGGSTNVNPPAVDPPAVDPPAEEQTTYNVQFFWESNGISINSQDATLADKKIVGSSFSVTIGGKEYWPCRGYEFKELRSTSEGISAADFPALKKTGWIIDGWYLRKYGQEWSGAAIVTSVAAGEIPAGTTTSGLFPHWVRPTLSPDLAGGTWTNASEPFTSGGALAGMPTKEGHWFAGWYTAAEGGEAVATAAEVIANVTPDASGKYPIYAHWTPINASAGQAVLLGGGQSSDGFNRILRNATSSGGLGASSAKSIVVSHDATTQGKVVSESDSPVPVYATYDSGTDQVTLHVASSERIKLNSKSGNLCAYLDRLQTFDFDQFDTSEVEEFSYFFYDCTRLTSINGLGSIDLSSAHYTNKMFQGCNNLENTTLRQVEQWPAEKVNANFWAVDCMFNSCYQLESMDLSSWTLAAMNNSGQGDGNGNDVTNGWLDSMFGRCTKLEYLNLQGIDMREWKATSIYVDNISRQIGAQDIVENCTSLKTLVLGEGFKQDDYGEERYRHIAKFPVAMTNGSQTCAAGDAIPNGAGTWVATGPLSTSSAGASSLQSAGASW